MSITVPFQTIQFSISMQFKCKLSKTFQAIQFSWLIGFYGISTFVDHLMPNSFLYK